MLQAKKHGRPPELISFDEDQWREHTRAGVFMGKAPMLYLPGKPAFERLLQRWLDRGGHYVSDLRKQTEGRAWDLFQRSGGCGRHRTVGPDHSERLGIGNVNAGG